MYPNENLRYETHLTVQGQLDPHILITADHEGLVKPANLDQLGAPGDDGWFGDVRFEQQSSPEFTWGTGWRLQPECPNDAAFRIDSLASAGNKAHGGARFYDRELSQQFIFQPFVIGIQEGDVVSARLLYSDIHSAAFAAVLLEPDQAEIAVADFLDAEASIVVAPVIYDDDFHFWIILTPDRGECPFDGARCIICGDQNGDRGIGHIVPTSLRLRRAANNILGVSSFIWGSAVGLRVLDDRPGMSSIRWGAAGGRRVYSGDRGGISTRKHLGTARLTDRF